jgi:dTDP-4-amino-4,6-dideoxygalactose transaminase
LKRKREIFDFYKEEISKIDGLTIADAPEYCNANYWMIAMQIDNTVYGKDREGTMAFLGEHKIQTRPLWQLNHLQKPYIGSLEYKIENAYRLVDNTLNIPVSTNITDEELNKVVNTLRIK